MCGIFSGYNSSYSPYGMRSGYGSYGGYGGMSSYSGYGGLGGYGSYGSGYGGGYGSYGSPYSSLMSYGRGGYGGYGMNGQMPHMPGQDNRYSTNNYDLRFLTCCPFCSFIQMAEESSRPAFQSLESMVHAFGSVSMMLESTFFAIHSSFRAVLGVAENFGRMRGMLAQVFSALTIFKAVRWAYHQLLVLLGNFASLTRIHKKINFSNSVGIRKRGSTEKIWAEATADSGMASIGGPQGAEARKSSAWPIVMFMSLVMGGPYLIWKLLRSVLSNVPDAQQSQGTLFFLFNLNFSLNFVNLDASNEPWMVGKAPCMIGKASFNYQAGSADELSFNMGDVIAMAPTDKQPYQADGWLLARKIGDASGAHVNGPSPIGLVPSNHFKTLYNSKFLLGILFIF